MIINEAHTVSERGVRVCVCEPNPIVEKNETYMLYIHSFVHPLIHSGILSKFIKF